MITFKAPTVTSCEAKERAFRCTRKRHMDIQLFFDMLKLICEYGDGLRPLSVLALLLWKLTYMDKKEQYR